MYHLFTKKRRLFTEFENKTIPLQIELNFKSNHYEKEKLILCYERVMCLLDIMRENHAQRPSFP